MSIGIQSLRSQTVEVMRDKIVSGQLEPGARLIERELCEELDISRPTLREALRQLEAEGFVEIRPHKGPSVIKLSDAEAREMFEFREALECFAVYLFVQRASDAEVRALSKAVDALEDAHLSGDVEQMMTVKNQFYDVLYEGARNTVIHDQIRLLYSKLARLRARSLSHPGRPEASIEEIRGVMDEIRMRNAGSARDLWREHIHNATATALEGVAAANPSP